MADPVSMLTGVGGLLALTVRTSSSLHKIYGKLKNGPLLIIALSNEIADLSLVLDRVNSAKETLERLDPAENAAFITALDGQLDKARGTLQETEATALKDEVRDVRHRINDILIAHNSAISARIELELRTVSKNVLDNRTLALAQGGAFSHISTQLSTVLETTNRHRQETVSELGYICREALQANAEVSQRLSAIETVMMALLTAQSTTITPNEGRSRPRITGADFENTAVRTDTIFFGLCLTQAARCPPSCPCRCHLDLPSTGASWSMPPGLLRSVLGLLFVGYSGFPVSTPKCDYPQCAKSHTMRTMRVTITYAFPVWLLQWALCVYLQVSAKGAFYFGLSIRRRVRYSSDTIFHIVDNGTLETALKTDNRSIHDVNVKNGRSLMHFAIKYTLMDVRKYRIRHGTKRPPEYDQVEQELFPFSGSYFSEDLAEDLGFTYIHKIVVGICQLGSLGTALKNLRRTSGGVEKFNEVLNALDLSGATALHYAASLGDTMAARELLAAGARCDIGTGPARTALHWVVRGKSEHVTECVGLLLDTGADINAADFTPGLHRPIHSAISHGNHDLRLVQQLVERGADLESNTSDKAISALSYAICRARTEIIRYLLVQPGVQVENLDQDGDNILANAIQVNAHDIIIMVFDRLLLLNRAVEATQQLDNLSNTMLHQAALLGDVKTMEILAGYCQRFIGVLNPHKKNKAGLTAQQVFESRKTRIVTRF
ncbi:ankyrin repeat-containing domain protein [Apodospora peruviana]|uniref:Ankyrin repeat-containing domain protein n=1 Tax=Apodospora peruviana TaxID=516989 RepID=A0AAE0I5M3_9PEZI|nr:ankyrin repeat-containing domain protein [Apodospora peruviana]